MNWECSLVVFAYRLLFVIEELSLFALDHKIELLPFPVHRTLFVFSMGGREGERGGEREGWREGGRGRGREGGVERGVERGREGGRVERESGEVQPTMFH